MGTRQTKQELLDSVEQLIEQYEKQKEKTDDFLTIQDRDMKITALKSIKRDIEAAIVDE